MQLAEGTQLSWVFSHTLWTFQWIAFSVSHTWSCKKTLTHTPAPNPYQLTGLPRKPGVESVCGQCLIWGNQMLVHAPSPKVTYPIVSNITRRCGQRVTHQRHRSQIYIICSEKHVKSQILNPTWCMWQSQMQTWDWAEIYKIVLPEYFFFFVSLPQYPQSSWLVCPNFFPKGVLVLPFHFHNVFNRLEAQIWQW